MRGKRYCRGVRCLVVAPVLLVVACSKPAAVPTDADVCAPVRSKPLGSAGFHPYSHSHNDYEQPRPLLDALDAKIYSVEADLYLRSGEIVVAHGVMDTPKGTLKALYLDPLQARVTQSGSVYGDGVELVLWLDLKDGSAELRTALAALLDQYPMLTIFTDDAVTQGPVTAVLTGDEASKKAFVDERATRRAIRDRGAYATTDARVDNRAGWYALEWGKYMTWDGTMTAPESEKTRLGCLVGDMHAKGARIRFWKGPETKAFRELAIATGLDVIGTDYPQALNEFLAAVPP